MRQSNVKEYFKPTSLEEAISTLSDYEGNIKIIAGATDLYTNDHKDIEALVDITKLGLNYIKEDGSLAKKRKLDIKNKILRLQELIECL